MIKPVSKGPRKNGVAAGSGDTRGGGEIRGANVGSNRMDASKAMALLGLASNKAPETITSSELQTAFMNRVHELEGSGSERRRLSISGTDKRDELRRLNEAFQFLTFRCKQVVP